MSQKKLRLVLQFMGKNNQIKKVMYSMLVNLIYEVGT